LQRRHEILPGVRRKMDAFSEVLSGVRLSGAIFQRAILGAVATHDASARALASTLAPGAPHLVIYHFVVDGTARARLDGGAGRRTAARRHRGLSPWRSAPLERELRSEPDVGRRDQIRALRSADAMPACSDTLGDRRRASVLPDEPR
jgi:hypothetical protein